MINTKNIIQELNFRIARKKVITHFSVKSHPKYAKRVKNLIKQIDKMEVDVDEHGNYRVQKSKYLKNVNKA